MAHYSITRIIDVDQGAVLTSLVNTNPPEQRVWVAGDIIDMHLIFARDGADVTETEVDSGDAFVRVRMFDKLGSGGVLLASNDGVYDLVDGQVVFAFSLDTIELEAHMETVTGNFSTVWFEVEIENAAGTRRITALQDAEIVRKQGASSTTPSPASGGTYTKAEAQELFLLRSEVAELQSVVKMERANPGVAPSPNVVGYWYQEGTSWNQPYYVRPVEGVMYYLFFRPDAVPGGGWVIGLEAGSMIDVLWVNSSTSIFGDYVAEGGAIGNLTATAYATAYEAAADRAAQASAAAAASKVSEDNAVGAAGAAETHRDRADDAAEEANQHATNAATSATNAGISSSAAATSETNAAESESNAKISETNAAISAATTNIPAHTNPRALAPTLHFDGVTPGARATTALGAHATGMTAYTLPFRFQMPTSNPATARGLGGLSGISTAIGPGGIGLRLATNGDLQVRYHGATTGDYIQRVVTGARAAYSGQMVEVALVVSAAGPVLYINGVAAGLTAETTLGTPPAWTAAPAAAHFVLGVFAATEIWQGRLSSAGPLNYAKTLAEIADLVRNGPTTADSAAGSMVDTRKSSAANSTAAGFGFATLDPAGEDGFEAAYDPANSTNRAGFEVSAVRPGEQIEVRFTARTSGVELRLGLADQPTLLGAFGAGYVVGSAIELTEFRIVLPNEFTGTANRIVFRVNSPPSGTLVIGGLRVRRIGLIANPQVTRSAQLRDTGSSRLHGVLTSGVTPIGGTMQPITWTQSGTGYVLGNNHPLIHDPHVVSELWAKPTTATIPSVTLRRNDPAGTVGVASETTGAMGAWKKLTVIPAASEGAALDKYHLTFSQSAACDFRLVPQPL